MKKKLLECVVTKKQNLKAARNLPRECVNGELKSSTVETAVTAWLRSTATEIYNRDALKGDDPPLGIYRRRSPEKSWRRTI